MLIEKKLFTRVNLINLLIAVLPLSLIIGNSAVNINVVLICLAGIMTYKFELFRINKKIYQYLIFSFFLYLILITLITNIPLIVNYVHKTHPYLEGSRDYYIDNIIKSFSFLRFLILFLVVNKLVQYNHFNFKFFYVSCSFFVLAVSVDIVIQVIFGKNLFGYPILHSRPTSFFLNEFIAGGYIQKFSLFFIFFCVSLVQKDYKDRILYLLFFLFFIPLLLTVNRMPLLLYLFSFLLILILRKKFKYILVFSLIFFFIFFGIFKYYSKTRLGTNINVFYESSTKVLTALSKLNSPDVVYDKDGYILLFRTAGQIWEKNKVFGSGIKSFKLQCTYEPGRSCATHPHNYTLELLVDTGGIGFVIMYLIFIFAFFDSFKFYLRSSNLNSKLLFLPFFIIVFLEFFPLRSSGSFFSTSNATVIFFMLALLIGVLNLKKLNNN